MKLNSKRLYDLGVVALAVMLVQVALAKWVYPLAGKTVQGLYSIQPTSAVTSQTFGNQILGYVSGIFAYDFATLTPWLTMFIGSFLILLAGYYVYEQKWAWKGRSEAQRLWAILGYGSAVLAAIVYVTKISELSVIGINPLIGLAINYALIAFVVSGLATKVKFFKFLRI